MQIFPLGHNENVVILFSYVYVRRETISPPPPPFPLPAHNLHRKLAVRVVATVAFPSEKRKNRVVIVKKKKKKPTTCRQTNTCQLSNAGHFLLAKTTSLSLLPLSPPSPLSVSLCSTTLCSLSVHSKMHKGPLTCASATEPAKQVRVRGRGRGEGEGEREREREETWSETGRHDCATQV